ncbi:MAG: UDP-3-O-(3-hydroxymyristoyl)glucosamine N-acyltransferase [Candidatus Sumerlaeaceae bacterium]|nr:UDP-3-O-(3-hydroxymyristoyl)glucosamine N-acyltransferase [Candidatus Sumerlaeaceae bacterium]
MRLTEFAAATGGHIENLAEDFEIRGVSTLERAGAGEIAFVASEKYLPQAASTRASAVIVGPKIVLPGRTLVRMAEPWAGVLLLLEALYPAARFVYFSGVHTSAQVDPSASLGPDVVVGPNAVIGPRTRIGAGSVIGPAAVIGPDCQLGEKCFVHAGAVICAESVLGARVIIHPGAVIGADGFKYEKIGGTLRKIPQVGRVVIGDDVEIGANACVDRASFTETRIGPRTKIDNLVQIAHNVVVGADCILVSQVGVAGSSEVGDGSILAAQAGIADNLKLGRRVTVMARAAVKDHLKDGEAVVGMPARPFRLQAKIFAAEARLPEILEELRHLRARVEQLENQAKKG